MDFCRERLRDDVEPYFISDELLKSNIIRAERDIAFRTKLFNDHTSPITSIPIAIGDTEVALSPLIIQVDDAYNVTTKRPVWVNNDDFDLSRLLTEQSYTGSIHEVLVDVTINTLVFRRSADKAQELKLRVIRYPLNDDYQPSDMLEVDDDFLEAMYHRVAYSVFLSEDTELAKEDPQVHNGRYLREVDELHRRVSKRRYKKTRVVRPNY